MMGGHAQPRCEILPVKGGLPGQSVVVSSRSVVTTHGDLLIAQIAPLALGDSMDPADVQGIGPGTYWTCVFLDQDGPGTIRTKGNRAFTRPVVYECSGQAGAMGKRDSLCA